jgi:hypothetical protein
LAAQAVIGSQDEEDLILMEAIRKNGLNNEIHGRVDFSIRSRFKRVSRLLQLTPEYQYSLRI